MSRELKFKRAHFGHDGEFLELTEWGNLEDGCFKSPSSLSGEIKSKAIDVQYTGLKDMKGKMIHEGDILRYPAIDQWEETNYNCFEVFYHSNDACDGHVGFQFNRMHSHGALGGGISWPFKPQYAGKMIIIGNIFENPELLKK